MKKPRVLVTGATGFVGRYVVPALNDAGYSVIALTRQDLISQRPGIRVLHGDLAAPHRMRKYASVLRDCQIVVHLAGCVPRTPAEDNRRDFSFDQGLALTRNLLEFVEPRLFIFGSTLDVYGPAHHLPIREDHPIQPRSFYAAAKVAAEGLLSVWCASSGVALTILRFTHIYGPGDTSQKLVPRTIAAVSSGKQAVLYGGGRDTRDYLFATDAAEGVVAAVRRCIPGPFNLASGRETRVSKIVEEIIHATGRQARPILKPSNQPAMRICLDVRRAKRDLHFSARTSLSDGIQDTVRLFRPTVVFDLDGTLLDVRRRYFDVYRYLLTSARTLQDSRYWSLKRSGYSDHKIVAMTVTDSHLLNAYDRRRLRSIESPSYLKLDQPVRCIREVLSEISKQYNLVLTTARQNAGRLAAQLEHLGLRNHFQAVLTTGPASGITITAKKTRLIRQLGVPVIALIGDTPSDIEIARNLGAAAVAVSYGIRNRKILSEARPDHIVSNPADLPGLLDRLSAPRRIIWPMDWAVSPSIRKKDR